VRSRVDVSGAAIGVGDGHGPGAVRAFLCDGILCDGFIWKYLWDDLAPVLPLTHWHYRGHGRSALPVDTARIDIAAHAADLLSVRQHVGDPPAVLVGHSMGCQVALEAYHRHPERVRGLVLICGSFGKVTATFRGVPILDLILPKLVDAVIKHEDLARALWSRIPPEVALKVALKAGDVDPEKIHPEDLLPYLRHMTHVDLPMFLRMLRAAGEHSAEDYLGMIDVPVLIVAGERDTFTPAFLAESMASAIPRAELLMVKKGTHVAAIEQPELVDARIAKFLRERVLG
jgi:pimeloyl-ACP methyl ester carboxylesterase